MLQEHVARQLLLVYFAICHLFLDSCQVADMMAFEAYCLSYSQLIAATKLLIKAKDMLYSDFIN